MKGGTKTQFKETLVRTSVERRVALLKKGRERVEGAIGETKGREIAPAILPSLASAESFRIRTQGSRERDGRLRSIKRSALIRQACMIGCRPLGLQPRVFLSFVADFFPQLFSCTQPLHPVVVRVPEAGRLYN